MPNINDLPDADYDFDMNDEFVDDLLGAIVKLQVAGMSNHEILAMLSYQLLLQQAN